jgi:hypothetical protein
MYVLSPGRLCTSSGPCFSSHWRRNYSRVTPFLRRSNAITLIASVPLISTSLKLALASAHQRIPSFARHHGIELFSLQISFGTWYRS